MIQATVKCLCYEGCLGFTVDSTIYIPSQFYNRVIKQGYKAKINHIKGLNVLMTASREGSSVNVHLDFPALSLSSDTGALASGIFLEKLQGGGGGGGGKL